MLGRGLFLGMKTSYNISRLQTSIPLSKENVMLYNMTIAEIITCLPGLSCKIEEFCKIGNWTKFQ